MYEVNRGIHKGAKLMYVSLLRYPLTADENRGNRRDQGAHLCNLGSAYDSLGQYEKAIDHYQQARAIYAELGLAHEVERVDRNIARAQAVLDTKIDAG